MEQLTPDYTKPYEDKHELENLRSIELEQAALAVSMGYSKTDIIGSDKLKAGLHNSREVKEDHINAIVYSLIFEGVLHKDPIILVLYPEWVDASSVTHTSFTSSMASSLSELKLTAKGKAALMAGKIIILTGTHRRGARAAALERASKAVGSVTNPKKVCPDEDPREHRLYLQVLKDAKYFPVWILDGGE